MTDNSANLSRPMRRARVIALQCSAAGVSQWRTLAETLSGRYEMLAPEHYGSKSIGHLPGEHAFALADEAARTIELVDGTDGAVHLVGHSYGGGVALAVALARPHRVASMALCAPADVVHPEGA